jgi:hypothetical protein
VPPTSEPASSPPRDTLEKQAAKPAAATAEATEAPSALLLELKKARVSLQQGIEQAERSNGVAISAKYELEEGKLSLSVYTAQAGLDQDAEHNVLMELSGDATQSEWAPKSEVFSDKEHITRASYHLTLMQQTRTKLHQVIGKAAAQQPGQVYSIIPGLKERTPVFHVSVATPTDASVELEISGG